MHVRPIYSYTRCHRPSIVYFVVLNYVDDQKTSSLVIEKKMQMFALNCFQLQYMKYST